MAFVLALDQGTTSSRAVVFDQEGNAAGMAQREFEQIFPRAGWVEHDPAEIWTSQASVITEALSRAHCRPRDIVAAGITNQRETTVVWDRETGEPVYNAIVWQDRRTSAMCERLRAGGAEQMVRSKTGLVIDAYFSGTKIAWILDNVAGARERAERGKLAFGTVDSWLIWKLTSHRIHATDPSNASRTLLFNIHTGDWDEELLQLLRVPRSMLPKVESSSGVIGEITTSLGPANVPIAGVAGDQQAALFGQTCFTPGMAKTTYGTGCFMLQNMGDQATESKHKLLTTTAWKLDGLTTYALEGSVFIGGAVVQWLRDQLGVIRSAAEVEALARSVPDNGGVYLVPAFAGLGAPHWDQYARGALMGLTRGSSAAHIARAALEGVAYQVADVLDAMQTDSGIRLSELRVDGGASRNNLLMQFQADILGVPVVRSAVAETTALGAAYLAGLATGFWKTPQEVCSHWKSDASFEPSMAAEEARKLRGRWARAVERARAWEDVE